MARKSKTGKTVETLNFEREQRFYASMQRISNGQTRKSAILAEKMDPRTFNKLLRERETGGHELITKIDKKGHYEIGHAPGSVSEWRVLDDTNHMRKIYVDKKYSEVLGRYWNSIENYLVYGNSKYLTSFKPTTIFTVDGIPFHLQLNPQAVKIWYSRLSQEQRDNINDTLYVKETSYAA